MNDRTKLPAPQIDPDDIGYNDSGNPTFDSILSSRLSRRDFLLGSASTGAMAIFGAVPFSAFAGHDHGHGARAESLLGFKAVAKSLADVVSVPEGYSYSVLCALGDPLAAGVSAYSNNGTDSDFEYRFGDHHDGMEYFELSESGKPHHHGHDRDHHSSSRALIGLNHEATTDELRSSFFLHANGGTSTLPRPAAEVDKEMAVHGISVFEIRKNRRGQFAYVQDSAFNFRIHQNTPVEISGPARGNALLVTKYSNNGTMTRGTLNNCGTGKTPWGTLLTGEENWTGYFFRNATDNAARGNDKSVTSLNRYGRSQGAASRHGWETGGVEDKYARWDISLSGAAASDDYRNELNTMGYIVEIDPYDKTQAARKRTALGRFAHEAAAFCIPKVGKPIAVYQGDDARGEYIYKWVSTREWHAADAHRHNRLEVGDKYLNDGKLYVAQFNADGTGTWLELSINNPAISAYTKYTFADQADVCINSRLAADAVGATKMDRPEWSGVNPANGEIYFALTNNSNRRTNPTSSQQAPDAANPRAYSDLKGGSKVQNGNVNGHILRVREAGNEVAATTFSWDIYLFGAESTAGADINLSGLTADQDFSSPDGLVFTPSTGICWIQTDDGAYTDVTNCMMLAALPGQVGDGGAVTVPGTNITTYQGKLPKANTLKRFLVGAKDCEITGVCETPDGKAMFVNIQHPGEGTAHADIADPTKYTSHWPGNAGYGSGGIIARPRSATIVITKNDGGRIGS
ncbi:MAG: phosphatase [Gallionellales bacterium 35-53-114]|jgi:secreted PhoX family phosphatase|nr:MAG: phosphatase [Gallionellales bacterium 35-53-114]OYZ63189.1 MAG: phosphatase [Gallionellales bacterium 24-53-125]OZB08656.1 MAG: phosphatase [Gallionellales bacterium 39-52-133]HQS57489.1 PhoX family phosphatase [Gallionellaceae bacterium]HQS74323.1 PhoX family phosphatase [Gallionellaceae bacterium]